MGRNPRIHFAGAVYHVMARGVDGRDIFIDDLDRTTFLAALTRIEKESTAHVIAYCLMGNHFHLAIKVSQVALSSVMQRILTGYSVRFNARHDRTGHLFQARYKSILCVDDPYLIRLISYIHLNPVRAGIAGTAEDWAWSSIHRYGPVSDNLDGFDPWPKAAEGLADRDEDSDIKLELDVIGSQVAAGSAVTLDSIRSRAKTQRVVAAKRQLVREAISQGHSLTVIAAWLKTALSSVSRYSR